MKHWLIKNLLSRKIRKEFIKKTDPLLLHINDYPDRVYPGKQTKPDLHLNSDPFVRDVIMHIANSAAMTLETQVELESSWVNWTNGKKKDINWHIHNADYALVYYMKILPFFDNGTLFKHEFIKVSQNSALIFPAAMTHTAPSCPFHFDRYTLAMNLNIIR